MDERSLFKDCNGKLWFFKKHADTEKSHDMTPQSPLFTRRNIRKIKVYLRELVTGKDKFGNDI